MVSRLSRAVHTARRRGAGRVVVAVAVVVAVGGCTLGGGAPKEPLLGTRDACALFDAERLAAAVPDGRVLVSALGGHNDLGNAGTCEFTNRAEGPAGEGDFAELRLEVDKAFGGDAADAHEDAVNRLRNICRLPPLTAPVQGPDDGAEQWCEWNEPDPTRNIHGHYSFAVRRDLMVVSARYEYQGPVDLAGVERARQVTRSAARSALP